MRLIAENLGGERGGRRIFSDIGFSLGAGDLLVINGPNGAGKSTLLRIVAGLLPPSEGVIRLVGNDETFPSAASAAHYLGHLNGMKPALTVAENLSFWRAFHGASIDVGEALDAVDLTSIMELPFGYLSTGQRRRAAIARLLVSHRPVWLLDEPTAGLDTDSERQFSALMAKHLHEGGMIIAATHLPLGIEGGTQMRLGGTADA